MSFAIYAMKSPAKAARLAGKDHAAGGDERAHALVLELRKNERCVVCGRDLKNPTSVRLGIGPECRKDGVDTNARWRLQVLRDAGYSTALDTLDFDEETEGDE